MNLVCRRPSGNSNSRKSNFALVMTLYPGPTPRHVVIFRDSGLMILPATSLVPGDIVRIVAGQKVPVDVKLIEVHNGLSLGLIGVWPTGEVCAKTRFRAHGRNQIFVTSLCSWESHPRGWMHLVHALLHPTCPTSDALVLQTIRSNNSPFQLELSATLRTGPLVDYQSRESGIQYTVVSILMVHHYLLAFPVPSAGASAAGSSRSS